MSTKRRWLWPSSDSRFLKREVFSWTHCAPCAWLASDVLLPGSDDEGDEHERKAKRRKIVRLGRQYLSGRPLIIPSASLRGPFGIKDVSSEAPEPFDHDLRISISDDAAKIVESVIPDQPLTSTVIEQDDRCSIEVLEGIAAAKRLSSSALRWRESDLGGLLEAKRLSQAAVTDLGPERAHDGSELQLLLGQEGHEDSLEPHSRLNNKVDMPSPFIYRRGKLPKRQSSEYKAIQVANDENGLPKHDRESEAIRDDAPCGESQDRTAANYANARLSRFSLGTETPHSIKKRLQAEMRQSGAFFEGSGGLSSPTKERSALQSRTVNAATYQASSDPNNDSNELVGGTEPDKVPISTQAALREAHLDLLRASPAKAFLSPDRLSARAMMQDLSQSPVPAVTPFATFHERYNERIHDPQISTQNILNNFSPFQISQADINQGGKGSDGLLDPIQLNGTPNDGMKSSQTANLNPGWSFAALASSPRRMQATLAPRSPQRSGQSQRSKVSTGSRSKPDAGLKGMGFKVTKSAIFSGPMNDKSCQSNRRDSDAAKDDTSRSLGRAPSLSLSQILHEISPDGQVDMSFDHALSQASKYSLCKSNSSEPDVRRGQVIDWDENSVASADLEDPTPLELNASRINDSFANTNIIPLAQSPPPDVNSRKAPRPKVTLSFSEPEASAPFFESARSGDQATGASSIPASTLKSALRKATQKSSQQDAQRDCENDMEMELDNSMTELGKSVLGSWDVDSAIRGSVRDI
ncbi:hypothetical protein ANO11243_030230 [Dothideomycetidae sp. 11243]|nr:hypothetical protein ANO11243_030230 [fungal sp. No.11243]